jgi:hypothetical protein
MEGAADDCMHVAHDSWIEVPPTRPIGVGEVFKVFPAGLNGRTGMVG